MAVTIPRAKTPFDRGCWFPWVFGPERRRGAALTCPTCCRGMSIGGGPHGSVHVIGYGGQVSPSVVCPGCGWHVYVTLLGWEEQRARRGSEDEVQIVAVLPGGAFESLGLVALQNLDAVMGCLVSLDTRGGHAVSLIDIKLAYERAKSMRGAREAPGRSGEPRANNDADDDGA